MRIMQCWDDGDVERLVQKAGYLYARTTQNVDLKLNVDHPMALHTHCHFLAPDFWEKFETAKAEMKPAG